MRRELLRSTALGLCMALVVFALVTQRSLLRGEQEMLASDLAFDAGQLEVSVRHARRAATLYVPGAAHVARAHERLKAVAIGAERARDTELAMSAWRAVRAAAIESRHVWVPHASELERANLNLARLSDVQNSNVASPMPEFVDGRVTHPGWVMLQALGFAGAFAGLLLISWRGLTRSGRVLWDRMRLPALLFATGLISFGVALLRA